VFFKRASFKHQKIKLSIKEQDLKIKRASFQSKEQRVLERQRWVFCAWKPCGHNMVVKRQEEEQHQQRKRLYKDLTSFKL
jgi:hypothetical protein